MQFVRFLILVLASACLITGVSIFEMRSMPLTYGYMLVFAGASIFLVSPAKPLQLSWLKVISKGWLLGTLGCLLALVTYRIGVHTIAALTIYDGAITNFPQMLRLWPLGVAILLVIGISLDVRRGIRIPIPQRKDLLDFFGIFLVALICRAWGPNMIAGDELMQTIEVLYIPTVKPSWLEVSSATYPFFIMHIMYLLQQLTTGLVDLLVLQKWLSFIAGSLSVALLYAIIRIFSSRASALGGALLLCFMGWHWLNSRFIYAYPLDLANIGAGVFLTLLAFRTSSITIGILAGICCAFALILQKVGVIMLPFIAYLGFEALFSGPKPRMKRVAIMGLVILLSLAVTYEPFIVQHIVKKGAFPRQSGAYQLRVERLHELGFSQTSALWFVLGDVFRQLQVDTSDFIRHMFRVHRPILDPVFSCLFSVGFLYSLLTLPRSQASRVRVVGFLVFSLPMILGFPTDDPSRGLARRMLASSLFLAWIGVEGAQQIVRRFASESASSRFTIGLCSIAALTNIYFAVRFSVTQPQTDWYGGAGGGIRSYAMSRLARDAASKGLPVSVVEHIDATIEDALVPSPRVHRVRSAEELRDALLSHRGQLQVVIIPWETTRLGGNGMSFVTAISDLVPSYLWMEGPPDGDGMPMIRYAVVRIN